MWSFTLVVIACALLATQALSANGDHSLIFGDCPAALVPLSSSMKCGSLKVPMDWDNPSNGHKIELGIVKIAARDHNRRIGPLFYNPGGPGGLASQFLARVASGEVEVASEILDRFDFIGVDVRGSGLSSPISCDRSLYNARSALYPTTPDLYATLVKHNQALRQSCIEMTESSLIDYMDAISIVHDHEAVRQALGEKLTWLGQSWGTLLASQYAELYPENVRGLLLDGVLSLSQSETSLFVESGVSATATMEYFFTWCEQSNATLCPIAHQNGSKSVQDIWTDLISKAEQSPIQAPGCASGRYDCPSENATATQIRYAALPLLYMPFQYFPLIAEAIYSAAFQNDATLFLDIILHVHKDWNSYNASQLYANVAITCQDWAHETSATDMFEWKQIANYDMPYLLGLSPELASLRQCAGWPQPKRNPPHKICIPETLAPKVLMVTNEYDPATPPAMAVQLQQEIGLNRSVLVERGAAGHTVYWQPSAFGGPTVDAMNRYLLTLMVPDQRAIYPN